MVIHPADFAADQTYDHKKAREFNLSYWAPFVELAAQNKVGIAFENMFWSGHHQRFCSQAEELIDFVQALDNPYAGICWDTGHANLSGQHQAEAIRKMGGLLKAMHINDNTGKPKKDEHLIPFFGTVDWQPIIKALREIGYTGNFSFEVRKPFRALPKELNVDLLRFLHSVGEHLIQLA
ncbi:MAG: sugar phosphate isomerase/epimerase [Clostridiales bacterium]|nr:sugar phosphate isomerase/epimerase [Clostridiales bacterium]